MRTQVAIVGAGPAGLLLSHLLHLQGVHSVVLESRPRDYVESRIRAGVLEQWVRDLLIDLGVGGRMVREGMVHHGVEARFGGHGHRIDFANLVGKGVTVYGQHEVVKDLIAARLETGGDIRFEAEVIAIEGYDSDSPTVTFREGGAEHRLSCDFIAGCDGFHGVCRASIDPARVALFERVYPFAWLGILAKAQPATHELVYANHENGFALLSMRSPEVSRLYLQCAPDEELSLWPDERVWDELRVRLSGDGLKLVEGPVLQKSVTAMRSFVAEPMRFGRLFLAGDAAHIVPPTGAKGMNLAVADVSVLARALEAHYRRGDPSGIEAYSQTCLKRIWAVQRFSWWMTSLFHRFDDHTPFDRRRQLAELEYVTTSRAAATALAENYVGLPFA